VRGRGSAELCLKTMAIPNRRKVAQLRAHIDHELAGVRRLLFSRRKAWRETRVIYRSRLFGCLFQAQTQQRFLDYFDAPCAPKMSDREKVTALLVFADQQIDNIERMLFSTEKVYRQYRATSDSKTRLFGRLHQARCFRRMFDYIAEMSPEDGKH